MKTLTSRIKVRRNDKDLGEYRLEQIQSLFDTGHFSSEEECYDERQAKWVPISDFLVSVEVPQYATGTPATEEDLEDAGLTSNVPQVHPMAMLSGWIAFLLAIAALVGVIVWTFGKQGEIAALKQKVGDLEKELAAKNTEYQRLLFASREIAEPNVVRGRVLLRNKSGALLPRPKVEVQLFSRKAIEEYLAARFQERTANPPVVETLVGRAAYFIKDLPKPIAITTTDASGRYEFSIPESGEYVVHTRMTKPTANGETLELWFVSFDSRAPLNTPVDITDTNVVGQFVPGFMINQAR